MIRKGNNYYKVFYAFTVKCNSRHALEKDFHDWMENAMKWAFDIQCYYFELDSKDKLHIHGVAIADNGFYKKKLMYNNFHQRIDELPSFLDLERWCKYIQEDYVNEDEYRQMLISYDIRHNGYCFLD